VADLQEVYYANNAGIEIPADYVATRSQVDLKFVLDISAKGKQLGLRTLQIGGRSYQRGMKLPAPATIDPNRTATPNEEHTRPSVDSNSPVEDPN